VGYQLSDGPVVITAGDPIPEGFTCLGRQEVGRGCPRGIPKLAAFSSQLAGALDDCLQIRVKPHLPCHAGKATDHPAVRP
jgi:hypothetical protein